MSDFITIYTNFNYVEGAIWIVVALGLPFFVKHPTKAKKMAVGWASLGFMAFGVSDLLEASSPGVVPLWLLVFKIVCGSVILSGRFAYIGWDRFRLTDRYFLFGLFCLVAVSGIIAIQLYFQF